MLSFSTVTVAVPSRPLSCSVVGLSAAPSGRTHPPLWEMVRVAVTVCNSVPSCVRSISIVAGPHISVPLPGNWLPASTLNCPSGTDEGPAGMVHGPGPHENGALLPAQRRAEPWRIHASTSRPDTVARPSLLADTATRPSRPSIVSPIGAVTLVKATQLTPDCPRLRGLHSVWP